LAKQPGPAPQPERLAVPLCLERANVRHRVVRERDTVAHAFRERPRADVDRQRRTDPATGFDIYLVGPPAHDEPREARIERSEVDLRVHRDPVELAVRTGNVAIE